MLNFGASKPRVRGGPGPPGPPLDPHLLCHSMNAVSLVGIPSDSGDTQTLPCAKRLFELFCINSGDKKKTLGTSASARVQAS